MAAAPTAWVVGKAKEEDFPDLAAAAKVKEIRKEKKKKAAKQTLSLNDFLKSVPGGPALGSAGVQLSVADRPWAPVRRAASCRGISSPSVLRQLSWWFSWSFS